ncbi:MAG: hypothetical protein SFU57_01995 [Gemmatimonadales bacterium]|nr:hypothetical protein [Gemmatimonadales bacterium]PKL92450.1 MAG: hypothetical protein CVV20_05700 [Gemmatimonadetes bacterium HGW-Gemmatimonadetes-1]
MRTPFVFLIAAAAACSSDSTGSSTTTTTLNADVAAVAADAAAEDVDVMAGMNGLTGTIAFGAAVLDPDDLPPGPGNTAGCGFGGGRFTCPPNTANGLTITRTLTFFDELDATQTAYDADLTARVDLEATLAGDVTRGPWTATISRSRDFSFTGLLGAETTRTINGTAASENSRARFTDRGPNRNYTMTSTATVEDVVVPVAADTPPWPLSGTVTREFVVTIGDQSPVMRTVVITFDGTATPPATVNGEPFTINLAERRAFRR